jgi:hypothetical protein
VLIVSSSNVSLNLRGRDHMATPRFVPEFIDVEQELFELPQRVRRISPVRGASC